MDDNNDNFAEARSLLFTKFTKRIVNMQIAWNSHKMALNMVHDEVLRILNW